MLDYKGAYSRENFEKLVLQLMCFLCQHLLKILATIFLKRILWEWRFLFLKTTPWDCEFDQLYNCENIQFLKLDKEIWVSKLSRKRPFTLIRNNKNLIEKLSIDRKGQLNEFFRKYPTMKCLILGASGLLGSGIYQVLIEILVLSSTCSPALLKNKINYLM